MPDACRPTGRQCPGPRSSLSYLLVVQLLVFVCSSAVVSGVTEAADDVTQQTEKLQQLRKQIESIKKDIGKMTGQRDDLQTSLEKTEKEIGSISADLRRLQLHEQETIRNIESLNGERAAERETLARLRTTLIQDLQTGYATGRQQRIKLLLNQQDPATVSRMLTYHGYLSRARAERMRAVQASVAHINKLEASLLEQQAEIVRTREQQAERAERLSAEQAERKDLLAGIKGDLKSRSSELTTLQADEQRVQALLQSLQRALRTVPPEDAGAASLRKLKGQLQWPVAGRITRRYGASQASGELKSSGIFIATAAGADVHAISSGRVAFADWLRGFGLLLIIDHGEGYMSLYGQNRSLYKEVGAWVNRGEVVAAAGNSGGQLRDGLYLELRKNGKPFNPSGWFKGQPVTLQAGHR
jgi:septal ring factor EnvC (AmiA/AmiB activator)